MAHSMTKLCAGLGLSFGLLFAVGCGGEVTYGTPEDAVDSRSEESSSVKWWNVGITYEHVVLGWNDTDLGVGSSTAIQLRNDAKLIKYGVYAWGYMPEFVDQKTGHQFRILHMRPQHQFATQVGRVYPAGYIVGISGGDTHDTGYGVYSTGPHLCIQTLVSFRAAFPYGNDGGGSPGAQGGSACHSATLNRTVGAGTCVQSASDARWYTCENGSWVSGRSNCGASYAWCHSQTLNKDVAPRTCVESRADRTWYQCDASGWNAPVSGGKGPLGFCSAEYKL